MFKKIAKALTSVTVVAVLGIGAALAQNPPKVKQAKDEAEVELYKQSSPQTNPDANKRLTALNSWKEKYPETDYKLERAIFYVLTYQALNQGVKMFEAAKEVLALDPKEINALGWVTSLTEFVPPTPDNLSTSEKAAQGLLQAEKPATGVDDAQWKTMKTAYDAMAHKTLGFIAISGNSRTSPSRNTPRALRSTPRRPTSPIRSEARYSRRRSRSGIRKPSSTWPELLL